jgi:hypothetical protein
MLRILLLQLIAFLTACGSGIAQETVSIRTYSAPQHPGASISSLFVNDNGAYAIEHPAGFGVFDFEGTGYASKLAFVSGAEVDGTDDIGGIYKMEGSDLHVLFCTNPHTYSNGVRYHLYYSWNGTTFRRLTTASGTRKVPLDKGSLGDLAGGGGGVASPAPDGKKTKYPIHLEGYFGVTRGYAKVDIDEDGHISVNIIGKHAGMTGRSRFTCAVVVTGFKNGKPHMVLNVPRSQTLTVGADIDGSAEKNETFTEFEPIKPEDIDNVRHVRVLFGKDVAGDNFRAVISDIIKAASEVLDEADAFYKKASDSEIGTAVAIAAAAG